MAKMAAAEALGAMKSPDSIACLSRVATAKGVDESVSVLAVQAIATIGGPTAETALQQIAATAPVPTSSVAEGMLREIEGRRTSAPPVDQTQR